MKDKWEEFILDVLLKLSGEWPSDVYAEKCAALYQCFWQYVEGDPMEGPCYEDLVKWMGDDENTE